MLLPSHRFDGPAAGGRSKDERGATLVEFALVMPVFMTLILGIFTGAQAYDHDLSITHAAREGARYAATLAKEPTGLTALFWWSAVEDRVVAASAGDLDLSKAGHYVCIALVKPDGTLSVDSMGNAYAQWLPSRPVGAPDTCYTSNVTGTTYSRVHVLVRRPDSIDTVFYSHDLTLRSQAAVRYEGAT